MSRQLHLDVSSGKLLVVLKKIDVLEFERHKFCYHIAVMNSTLVLQPGEEADYCPLDIYENKYIVPKWQLLVSSV